MAADLRHQQEIATTELPAFGWRLRLSPPEALGQTDENDDYRLTVRQKARVERLDDPTERSHIAYVTREQP